jgi:hypothetical protein
MFCLFGSVWKLQNRVSALEKVQSQLQPLQSRQQPKSPNQSSVDGQADQPTVLIFPGRPKANQSGCKVFDAAFPAASPGLDMAHQVPRPSFDAVLSAIGSRATWECMVYFPSLVFQAD